MSNTSLINKSISNKKVLVAMSGGVDSSVSAAILKGQGFDVTGAYIKTWQPEWLKCTWREERRDAMRVAARLNIPFITIDCSLEYKKGVVDYMISEYKEGKTPNPDIMCNKEIKFGSFFQKAMELGFDYIATGHYAISKEGRLYESADKNKDQSYFLYTLNEEILKKTIFPIGHLQKKDVRKIAKKYNLPNAEKKDSQGICFLGDIDMKDFLKHYIKEKEGDVLNIKGQRIGYHNGAWFFTIGERHGFIVENKTNNDEPYYVVNKDVEKNIITVSNKSLERDNQYARKEIEINSVILRRDILNTKIFARIRYRGNLNECILSKKDNKYFVVFDNPQEISSGQSVVLYNKEECFGGGVVV